MLPVTEQHRHNEVDERDEVKFTRRRIPADSTVGGHRPHIAERLFWNLSNRKRVIAGRSVLTIETNIEENYSKK